MLNRAQIIGHLGNDPEMRSLPSGDAVANLSIATSERWKDKATGEQKEATEWHRCALFGRQAEIAGQYLRKGSLVYVEGPIQTRKWQDQEGNDRYSTEIKGRVLKMLDKKGDNAPRSNPAPARPADPEPATGDFDDDIPF